MVIFVTRESCIFVQMLIFLLITAHDDVMIFEPLIGRGFLPLTGPPISK